VAFVRLHDFFKLNRDSARVRASGARDNVDGPLPPKRSFVDVNYLATSATSAAIVPEPTTVALIALGAVAILVRQIRRLRRPRPARQP